MRRPRRDRYGDSPAASAVAGLYAGRLADDNAAVQDACPTADPETVAVIDFETTGMSPAQGARATEIAVVLVRDGRIVDRYASLMNSGAWVPPFIEQLTGISNRMLADAPPAAPVMREVAALHPRLPAGGAQRRLRPRLLAGRDGAGRLRAATPAHDFACTLLLSRRLYPEAPNHKLGTLARVAPPARDRPRPPRAGRCRDGRRAVAAHRARRAAALRRQRAVRPAVRAAAHAAPAAGALRGALFRDRLKQVRRPGP